MKKIVLIPDSFKGTLSSTEVCRAMKAAIDSQLEAQVISIPVADGGEGSVEALLSAVGGQRRTVTVQNPFGEPMESFYGVIHDGKTAVIEMAACAGLPLAEGRLNPAITTTYGVGQLLAHALDSGCRDVILALGGSATNDGGAGCANALGVQFYNADNQSFLPTGGTLKDIDRIDLSGRHPLLTETKITVMCDIDNPLYGKTGAAYIFAPQKGADPEMVEFLDQGLIHYSEKLQDCCGQDVSTLPGGGAAGGFGAGVVALLGGTLKMGIDIVLDTVDFDNLIADADLIFTGEGKIDGQSIRGKVVVGVAKRAKRQSKPVIAMVGAVDEGATDAYDLGVTAIFAINRKAEDFAVSRHNSQANLQATVTDIVRLWHMK